eukprot:2380746-Prymnesium_polylepis.1
MKHPDCFLIFVIVVPFLPIRIPTNRSGMRMIVARGSTALRLKIVMPCFPRWSVITSVPSEATCRNRSGKPSLPASYSYVPALRDSAIFAFATSSLT